MTCAAYYLFQMLLATSRLSHLVSKECGPLSIFERICNALPRGGGSAKESVSCTFCFSLSVSAVVCLIVWTGGSRLTLQKVDSTLARFHRCRPDN
jgi:hypothetical protein